jgi:hypothetical protein
VKPVEFSYEGVWLEQLAVTTEAVLVVITYTEKCPFMVSSWASLLFGAGKGHSV